MQELHENKQPKETKKTPPYQVETEMLVSILLFDKLLELVQTARIFDRAVFRGKKKKKETKKETKKNTAVYLEAAFR